MENPTCQTYSIPSGTIEYVLAGKGPTILISHGTLGGFDQGLAVSRLFDQEKFCLLSVSMAGYLRSDASIQEAEYLPFPDGGHVFFVVHHAQLIPQIERFLSANLSIK